MALKVARVTFDRLLLVKSVCRRYHLATYNGAAAYHWGGATNVKQSTIQGKPFYCMRASMETYWNDDAGPGHSI